MKKLPASIPASASIPDLPSSLWTKETVGRTEDVQTIIYRFGPGPVRMQFNRVNLPNGGAFYLGATTVPLRMGQILVNDGKGPLTGASSTKGPVAWQFTNGQYLRRASWMTLDFFNSVIYGDGKEGAPPADESPMNGLSGNDALRLARNAGCALPSLSQWAAVMASPSGQQWQGRWQGEAKVRGPAWTKIAREAQARSAGNAGTKLPNDQCFGDKANLDPAGAGDANLFFEPVNQRQIGGFAHLIGNVGQYVVDNPAAPTRYYFAGGSAESAPTVFASLPTPPPVPNAFVAIADAGLRLAAPARGNGSDQNKPLEKLKTDLDAEIARVKDLP